jgi:Ran GTPase-activating protein (RanGAP) involved in mRNA processing and transport
MSNKWEARASETMLGLDLRSDDIDDSVLVAHAEALGTYKSLSQLLLTSNKITDLGMTTLAQAVKHNTTLTEIDLDLGRNKIGIVGWASFFDALATNKSVETLNIFNSLSDDGSVLLFEALKSNTTLTELELRGNDVANNGAGMLAETLKSNTALASLDLSYNRIETEGAMALLHSLKECNISLKRIEIGYNWLAASMIDAIRYVVSANHAGIRLIHAHGELNLTSRMHWCHSKILSEELAMNTTVTVLTLGSNMITDDGAAHIAAALEKNRTLGELGLSGNRISDRGALAIANVLHKNTTLQGLDLSDNSIGDDGVANLADALKLNTSLTKLALRKNRFGCDGAAAVAYAIATNTSLRTLDMSCNNINDKGTATLLMSLRAYNHTVLKLNLEGNPRVSPTLLEVIDSMLASRRVLFFWLAHLHKPLEEGMIPYAAREVNRGNRYSSDPELTHCPKTAGNAGFIYSLLRSAASKRSLLELTFS